MSSDIIKCLIIDDDPFIRELLQDKLAHHFPSIEVLSTAESGEEGLKKIASHQPELIFLDVEMVDMTGFEMLSQVADINFQTIFITSYSHYAIKAIRFNALDYLLKPIDLGELKKAINRFNDRTGKMLNKDHVSVALQNMNTQNVADHVMVLKTQEGELKIVLKDIVHIKGDRNYSYIYLKNDKKELVTKTLIDLEEILDSKGFFRCHRSHIVNRDQIVSYSNGSLVQLSTNIKLPISRRKKKSFIHWFDSFQNTNKIV